MTDQAIIELIEITKIYGQGDAQIAALEGINLTISAGEFVAIMGPPARARAR